MTVTEPTEPTGPTGPTGSSDLRTRLADVRGVVLDVDGCLILSSQPAGDDGATLPGAVGAVRELRDLGLPVVVFTNASSRPPADIAVSLASLGFPVGPDDVLTPSVVGAETILHRFGDRPALAFGGSGVVQVLRDAGVTVIDPEERDAARRAEVVLVGWDVGFDQKRLQVAAEAVWNGAPLLVTSDAPAFATAGGRTAGLGGFIANGLSYVTGRSYEVLGKPSPAAIDIATRRLGVASSELLVAGDDLSLEVAMARTAGGVGVLVTTGTHSRDDADAATEDRRPDLVVDSLAEATALVRAARTGVTAR
ncbi:HAD-IIA family hydrolase [Nocardioides sp. CFH 31398]|uniref:HAD-IIA family hydrolase n=1 Tax=Nocardioides sp. CFH 31398 TaxID=2919579 RepID=UPI001F05851B|nr:HAD-IIA family hydrolase [Nocardioides sp. CFH 31398]MCH1865498.1 HAD-IIA family hydrolase [Nocardioides sp. CFH 31398]